MGKVALSYPPGGQRFTSEGGAWAVYFRGARGGGRSGSQDRRAWRSGLGGGGFCLRLTRGGAGMFSYGNHTIIRGMAQYGGQWRMSPAAFSSSAS